MALLHLYIGLVQLLKFRLAYVYTIEFDCVWALCVSVWRAINHVTNVSILRVLVWTLENIKRKRFEEILSSLCIEVKNQARFHIHADITLPSHKFKVLNLLSYWFLSVNFIHFFCFEFKYTCLSPFYMLISLWKNKECLSFNVLNLRCCVHEKDGVWLLHVLCVGANTIIMEISQRETE